MRTPRLLALVLALTLTGVSCSSGGGSGSARDSAQPDTAPGTDPLETAMNETDGPRLRTAGDCPQPAIPPGTDVDVEILFTETCRPFVRTPDDRFENLPGFDFEPNYATVDGMRMHYVDEGPADGEVVLLLHGQPTWAYLYRKMIPTLVEGGHRVIALDMMGMGRSDKPVQIADYSYLQHVAWVEGFLDAVDLTDVTVFVQDWGSLIGLRVVGNNPERFARVVVANGQLPVLPEGFEPIQLPDSLEPDDDLTLPFSDPTAAGAPWMQTFGRWAEYALIGSRYHPAEVLEWAVQVDLTPEELAAYDAPFPSRIYMSATRAFPSLINTVGRAPTNEAARAALDQFDRPVLTLFGRRDPNMGSDLTQSLMRDRVPGAVGQPHHAYADAGHFIQEDEGRDLAIRVNAFIDATRG
jgi:haloalkane dehalogenase